jgi:tetratricopeptide (TPR) repeat protein
MMGFRNIRSKTKAEDALGLITEGDARMELRIPEEAIPFYTKALEIDPGNSVVWNSLGLAFFLVKEYQNALTSFDRALSLNSEYADARRNKGNVLVQLDRFTEAFQCYDHALKGNHPNPASVWHDKGRAFYSSGQYDEAISCFDRALQIDPRRQDTLLGKGLALCRLGNYKEAIGCYDQILLINPVYTRARAYRSIALEKIEQIGGKSQRQIHDFS